MSIITCAKTGKMAPIAKWLRTPATLHSQEDHYFLVQLHHFLGSPNYSLDTEEDGESLSNGQAESREMTLESAKLKQKIWLSPAGYAMYQKCVHHITG